MNKIKSTGLAVLIARILSLGLRMAESDLVDVADADYIMLDSPEYFMRIF
jgi:hypothetical protein